MNTYIGHKFYVKNKDDIADYKLMLFQIEEGILEVVLAPDDGSESELDRLVEEEMLREMHKEDPGAQSGAAYSISSPPASGDGNPKLHPLVRMMNQRTTSVGAKFKSLHPRPLRIWFEDGKDGIEQ